MFNWANLGKAGVARVAKVLDSDGIASGQIVKLTMVNGQLFAAKVVSGDSATTCELAYTYLDITDQTRRTYISTTLVSHEWDLAPQNWYINAVQGHDLFGKGDQFDDGNYTYGMNLTIDFATARLKPASGGDTVYAKVTTPGMISTDASGIKQGSVEFKLNI